MTFNKSNRDYNNSQQHNNYNRDYNNYRNYNNYHQQSNSSNNNNSNLNHQRAFNNNLNNSSGNNTINSSNLNSGGTLGANRPLEANFNKQQQSIGQQPQQPPPQQQQSINQTINQTSTTINSLAAISLDSPQSSQLDDCDLNDSDDKLFTKWIPPSVNNRDEDLTQDDRNNIVFRKVRG